MSDLIRRADAINALHDEFDDCTTWYDSGYEAACDMEAVIETLPSAQQWIPCSERLPEAGEVVLVYGKRGGIYTAVYNKPETSWKCGWWKLNSKSHYCMPDAWMPLPEPYEVEE